MSKKKRSIVWKHFVDVIVDETAKCIHCNQTITHSKKSTGNLLRHLRRHPELHSELITFTEIKQERVMPLTYRKKLHKSKIIRIPKRENLFTIAQRKESVPLAPAPETLIVNNSKKDELDKQLLVLITKECHPFSLVQEPEFKKFVHLLCPSYQLPSPGTLYSELASQHEVVRQKVKHRLERASSICITVEGWIGNHNDQEYYALTAHYIVGDKTTTKLSSDLIGCISFTENHSPNNVCMKIRSLLMEWDINDKVMVIVSDSAAIITAVKLGDWSYRGCFAHGLNVIVKTGLKDIEKIIIKVKTIIDYLLQNSNASELLRAQQEIMNLPKLELKIDVKTSWNSIFLMLQNILTLKNAVVSTMSMLCDPLHESEENGSEIILLTDYEWQVIEQCVNVLEIFDGVTNVLSSEKKPLLASTFIVFYKQIAKHLDGMLKQDNLLPEVKNFDQKLQSLLFRRFENVEDNKFSAQSTLIDPRYKKYGFLNESKYQKALESLYTEVSHIHIASPEDQSKDTIVDQAETCKLNKKVIQHHESVLWKDFDEEVKKYHETANYYELASAMVEVDGYIDEPPLPRQQDPFLWWHQRKNAYPRLYQFMKARLCIMATSIPGERMLNIYGQTITDRRTLLHGKNIEEMIFLGYNLNNKD